MQIIFEIMSLLGFILAIPAIPIFIGHLRKARNFPEDAQLVKIFLDRARARPSSFSIENDSYVTAKDDIFKADSGGSLSAKKQSLNFSMWNEAKISRAVKRLWRYHGRTDAKKKSTLESLMKNA